jgi:hypothetical protein
MDGGFFPMNGAGALVRVYLPELVDIVAERVNPGRVPGYETDLERIGEAYAAAHERRVIESSSGWGRSDRCSGGRRAEAPERAATAVSLRGDGGGPPEAG